MQREPLIRRGFVYLYFDNMQNYSDEMEETLERRLQEHEEEYKMIFAEETDDEYIEFLSDQYTDRKYELTDAYPTLLRSSLMISIYSLIEKELLDVCRRLQAKKGVEIPLKDAKFRGKPKKGKLPEIIRAQKYLEQYCGVNFPAESLEWKQICHGYRKIRNKFVHDGQYLAESELAKFHGIKVFVPHFQIHERHRKLILEKGFCEEFIVTGEYFFMRLYNAIKENI